jgi:hypothetical protein
MMMRKNMKSRKSTASMSSSSEYVGWAAEAGDVELGCRLPELPAVSVLMASALVLALAGFSISSRMTWIIRSANSFGIIDGECGFYFGGVAITGVIVRSANTVADSKTNNR